MMPSITAIAIKTRTITIPEMMVEVAVPLESMGPATQLNS